MKEQVYTDLLSFGSALRAVAADENIIREACLRNPWFTPASVKVALNAMLPWFETQSAAAFVARYPRVGQATGCTGIVMAGNVPAVGLHDLCMALLAGGSVKVKLSSKDAVLMPALVAHLGAEVQSRIHFVPALDAWAADRFIATGSDNAARYFERSFGSMPHLIRRNRFSAALAGPEAGPEFFAALCEDLFLHCGLGCRSVSTVMLTGDDEVQLEALKQAIETWDRSILPDEWNEVLHWERALARQSHEAFIDAGTALLKPTEELLPGRMGIVQVWTGSPDEAAELLQTQALHLQCVVGREVQAGKSQFPAIDDFADGVDVLAWLLQ